MNEIILKEYMNLTYSNQCKSAVKRAMELPTYTKQELQTWLIVQPNYLLLFNVWIESGKQKWLKPSIDRKDDYTSYTLDNIQLMIWKENYQKGLDDKINGITNKNNSAILQYDTKGVFIKEFYSIHQAGREIEHADYRNIHKSCQDTAITVLSKFIFIYKSMDSTEYLQYRVDKYLNSGNKTIVDKFVQIDKVTGEVLNTFSNTREAKTT